MRTRKDNVPPPGDPQTVTSLLDRLVSDVLAASPAAARVFIDRHMGCVGCPFAPFETVREAAGAYGTEPCELERSLAEAQGEERPSEEPPQ